MFAKPYKQKSHNTLKNSEKRQLIQRLCDAFPSATEGRIKDLVPNKSNTNFLKLIVHSEDLVGVYTVDNVPMFLEVEEKLVPTVCALWKVPELVPYLIVHSPVLPKVRGGAPLYAPGVVTKAEGLQLPSFRAGDIISCSTTDNAAAGFVGKAIMSHGDLLFRGGGVVMETIHVFGDLLCKDPKFNKIERPKLGPPEYACGEDNIVSAMEKINIQVPAVEEWPSLGPARAPVVNAPRAPAVNAPQIIADEVLPQDEDEDLLDETGVTESSQIEDPIPTDMDGLLRWCLLSFLKLHGKNLELPLKTNLLYRNNLMPLCPSDRSLDVKKSSYKKMGKFLEAMQQEQLVTVQEIEKGVDALTAINLLHPALRSHQAPEVTPTEVAEAPVPPQARDLFCVTAAVCPVLPFKKGTPLTASEVRTSLQEYVKMHNLNSTQSKGRVVVDSTLAKIAGKNEQEHIKWEELISAVHSKMTASTELRLPDGTVKLVKTKLEPVTMKVATRSGNKKVTLVSNLEQFGFCLQRLCHECQAGVAASCGVTRTPGARADQLMLQGDQTYFIAKLLIEKYGMPKRYLDGADKALNKKKP